MYPHKIIFFSEKERNRPPILKVDDDEVLLFHILDYLFSMVHAFHLYIIQVDPAKRKGLYDFLRANNVFSQVLYIPAHTMPYYKSLGWKEGDMPVAEDYYSKCLALPMFPTLTDEEQDWIIAKVKEFMSK